MRKNTTTNRRSNATKVIASVALLAGAASVAGLGTFGAFTDTTAADQKVSTGTVEFVDLEGKISADVAGMVPGDRIEREVTLVRATGSETFGSVKLTTTATGDAVLTAPTTGLKLKVDECSVAWTPVGNAKECKGTTTAVLPEGDVLGQDRDLLTPLTSLNTTDGKSYLRVTLSLPRTDAEQNALQKKTATVSFKFDATQRAGEAR